jgi:hypothetical protein
VLLALSAWGYRLLSPGGAAIEVSDPSTGKRVDPVVVDRRTRRELAAGRVALRAGPGASEGLRRALSPPVAFGERSRSRRGKAARASQVGGEP